MITRTHASVALAVSLSSATTPGAAAFARASIQPPRPAFSISTSSPSSPSVSSSSKLNGAAHAISSEEDALTLLHRAEICANSDSCSIDDAKEYLRDVVNIQSGCVVGTLTGREACEDVTFAAGVVAGLRAKIEEAEKRSVVGAFALASGGGGSASILAPTDPLDIPLKVGILTLAVLYAASALSGTGDSVIPFVDDTAVVLPFTMQEWFWALRDGYLPDMIREYSHHGGLMQITSSVGQVDGVDGVFPFMPQEWWWAARDGYLGDVVSEFAKNGGFMVASETCDAGAENVMPAALPLRSEEWMWSMNDGYLDNVLSHVFRNGGL